MCHCIFTQSIPVSIGYDLKQSFSAKGFHSSGIHQNALSDGLLNGSDIFLFAYLHKNIHIKIHEDNRGFGSFTIYLSVL